MKFPYKSVVMVSPARLGDTIRYTPAIKLLKKNRPEIKIDVICLTDLAGSVLAHNPSINQVNVLPTKRETKRKIGCYDIGINIHDSDKARQYFHWLKVDVINQLPPNDNKHAAQQALEFIQSLLECDISENDRRYALYPQSRHFAKAKDLLLSQGASLNDDIL